jgi:hypothetical protein
MSFVALAVKREVIDPSPIVEILPPLMPQVQPTHMVQNIARIARFRLTAIVSSAGVVSSFLACASFASAQFTPFG